MHKGWLLPLALVLTCLQPLTSAVLTVTSTFSQRGVNGTITFTQASSDGPTVMDISLTGRHNTDSYTHMHKAALRVISAHFIHRRQIKLVVQNSITVTVACLWNFVPQH